MLETIIATPINIIITVLTKRWKTQVTVKMMATIKSSRTMSTVLVIHLTTKM